MESFSHLKLYCPDQLVVRHRPGRAEDLARRWLPLVFPWSTLAGMTGVVLSEHGAVVAHGRLCGGLLQIEGAEVMAPDDLAAGGLKQASVGARPVCVCLPRSRILVRHFRIPGDTPAEIDSMLPHLLAAELPRSLDHYSWVWDQLPATRAGFTLVAVYIARNDRLDDLLAPLARAGFNVAGFVPEGWAWAHASRQVHADDPQTEAPARSIIIRGDEGHYLVVEKAGRLLFDLLLPSGVLSEGGAAAAFGNAGPRLDERQLKEARLQFQELLDFSLPPPAIWPDNLPAGNGGDGAGFFYAGSVAACGLESPALMTSPEIDQRFRRRTWRGAGLRLGRLAALACFLWLVFTVVGDTQTRRYLDRLEGQIAQEQERVAVLESEFQAVREKSRVRVGNTEILQVVDSLRRHVAAPLYLESLNYVQGGSVTLRGGAPTSAQVLEMTDQLGSDPLWQGLRVVQLRTGSVGGAEQVHFVVEGQLR